MSEEFHGSSAKQSADHHHGHNETNHGNAGGVFETPAEAFEHRRRVREGYPSESAGDTTVEADESIDSMPAEDELTLEQLREHLREKEPEGPVKWNTAADRFQDESGRFVKEQEYFERRPVEGDRSSEYGNKVLGLAALGAKLDQEGDEAAARAFDAHVEALVMESVDDRIARQEVDPSEREAQYDRDMAAFRVFQDRFLNRGDSTEVVQPVEQVIYEVNGQPVEADFGDPFVNSSGQELIMVTDPATDKSWSVPREAIDIIPINVQEDTPDVVEEGEEPAAEVEPGQESVAEVITEALDEAHNEASETSESPEVEAASIDEATAESEGLAETAEQEEGEAQEALDALLGEDGEINEAMVPDEAASEQEPESEPEESNPGVPEGEQGSLLDGDTEEDLSVNEEMVQTDEEREQIRLDAMAETRQSRSQKLRERLDVELEKGTITQEEYDKSVALLIDEREALETERAALFGTQGRYKRFRGMESRLEGLEPMTGLDGGAEQGQIATLSDQEDTYYTVAGRDAEGNIALIPLMGGESAPIVRANEADVSGLSREAEVIAINRRESQLKREAIGEAMAERREQYRERFNNAKESFKLWTNPNYIAAKATQGLGHLRGLTDRVRNPENMKKMRENDTLIGIGVGALTLAVLVGVDTALKNAGHGGVQEMGLDGSTASSVDLASIPDVDNPFSMRIPDVPPEGIATGVDQSAIDAADAAAEAARAAEAAEAAQEALMSSPSFDIPSGGGLERVFSDLGFDTDILYDNERDLVARFPQDFEILDSGPGAGHIGIRHSGWLSEEAREYIIKLGRG